MKKAVNQWCFPNDTPVSEIFRTSEHAGLDGVELNLNPSGDVGITLDTTLSEASSIKSLAKQYGVDLPTLSTGLLWNYPLSSPNSEIRKQGQQIVRKQLEIASELEMDTILLVPGVVDAVTPYEECWLRSQAEISILAQYAGTLGVRIGLENVWNKFLLSPVEMVRFIDEIGSPSVGAYFDVGNALNFGFPEHWIHSLDYRIFKVHVKDFSSKIGNISGFVPLLAGDVNWKIVRQSLQDIRYDDYITAELTPYATDNHQAVYDASKHMDAIIQMVYTNPL